MAQKNTSTSTRSIRRPRPSTRLRVYNYDSGTVQQLFANIIESLGSPDRYEDIAGSILVGVCSHFKFACGFVYEADHTRTLILKERYDLSREMELPPSFALDRLAGQEAVSGLFNAGSIMFVDIRNAEGAVIGLVGMMDRRKRILLDSQAVDAAKLVLNLLANHIKLHLYRRNLQYIEQSLVSVLDNTGVDIYVNDFYTHEILYVNKSMAAPYGGIQNMLGKKCWEALYGDRTGPCDYCPQSSLIDENGMPTKIRSWDYRRPFDGAWFRVLSSAFRWVDGRLAHVVSSVDITENKRNEATIARMANYDALTNLPNRRKLMLDLDSAVADKSGFALLFFDLDRFKHLNDSMGHHVGDRLLEEAGRTLQENPYTKDRVYRYGGDEFIVLLPDAGREKVRGVVEFLLARFSQPWRLEDASPVCRASIGVAVFPEDAATGAELIEKADALMYRAKQTDPGTAVFSDAF